MRSGPASGSVPFGSGRMGVGYAGLLFAYRCLFRFYRFRVANGAAGYAVRLASAFPGGFLSAFSAADASASESSAHVAPVLTRARRIRTLILKRKRKRAGSISWKDLAAALQAFAPKAVAQIPDSARELQSWSDQAFARRRSRGWVRLQESPLVRSATDGAFAKMRGLGKGEEVPACSGSEVPDFPLAQPPGSFIACPKRSWLCQKPMVSSAIPSGPLQLSGDDLGLLPSSVLARKTGKSPLPKDIAVPAKALTTLQELGGRSLELVSSLDGVSDALTNAYQGVESETAMGSEEAIPILLDSLRLLVKEMANVCSASYVNIMLARRGAFLSLSTL